ncbi:hypothetical protein K6U06_14550 [Acidiferrimicrobium sp. IK]|uniref:hypothetical protein n=1 Tax=Acidiferrimicrobium sp. IK TaxID=2871700 RepID=UPI0021CB1432|nr:hypothetical protein [Acidiferrimicrobium sp. IK]MCU4185585.1 hypothetical protein [Acidiferrimicrobium sp. IK]
MEFLPGAGKHGVPEDSIRHVLEHALVSQEIGEDPERWLFLGPDSAGNLLEVVVIVRRDRSLLAVHAMGMRSKYRPLLP